MSLPSPHQMIEPAGWARPRGYSNLVAATGRLLFLAGQIGWNERQEFTADDLVGQARQALQNVVTLLDAAGARPEHLVRLTWFITDRSAYLTAGPALGAAYREVMGRHFPAMSAVQVAALIEARALVEIEATAVVPTP